MDWLGLSLLAKWIKKIAVSREIGCYVYRPQVCQIRTSDSSSGEDDISLAGFRSNRPSSSGQSGRTWERERERESSSFLNSNFLERVTLSVDFIVARQGGCRDADINRPTNRIEILTSLPYQSRDSLKNKSRNGRQTWCDDSCLPNPFFS